MLSLVNIAEETIVASPSPPIAPGKNPPAVIHRPLYTDLFVLCYANFQDKNYREGLTAISRAIGFCQQNPWFTHATLPALGAGIDRLGLEIVNLDLGQLHHLMGMLGVKYLPSVYCKLRLIPAGG